MGIYYLGKKDAVLRLVNEENRRVLLAFDIRQGTFTVKGFRESECVKLSVEQVKKIVPPPALEKLETVRQALQ